MKSYINSMVIGFVLTQAAQFLSKKFLKRELNQNEVMVATGVLSLVLSAVAKRRQH